MAVSLAIRVEGQLQETPADLSPDAVFPIYSITKTLTAICVLRLVEAGSLHLDDDVRQWLPEVNLPAVLTLTNLLRHTAGLQEYGPLPEYQQAVKTHPERPWTRQDFLDATVAKGLLFAPGEGWAYSNVGYMLVVDILERISGQSFAAVLDDYVVAPLNLRRTSVLERVSDLMRCVPGFGSEVTTDGRVIDVRGQYHPGWCSPRVVASTTEEITLVFDALFAGRLVSAGTLRAMLTVVPLPGLQEPPVVIGSGMGLYSNSASPYGRNYHHGGGGPGYDLSATIYPDTRIGRIAVAVFVDSSSVPGAARIEDTYVARLLEHAR